MKEIFDFEQPIIDLQNELESLRRIDSQIIDLSPQMAEIEGKLSQLKSQIYSNLTPWQRTLIARHSLRPRSSDYIRMLVKDFIELHGDRAIGDDPTTICGLGAMGERSIAIIGQEKGKDPQDIIYRNFGMPHPEGYRKALRVMKLAEKFNLPIITFIDTPGAYPGIEAENRGQATVIAENLLNMAMLSVPIISTIIGEGGSGGALAIGVADRVWMLENSIYSVISPEGCASILFSDADRKRESAEYLKLNAQNHLKYKLIDGIIPEPLGGIHKDPGNTILAVGEMINNTLEELEKQDRETLLENRYSRYRNIGIFKED